MAPLPLRSVEAFVVVARRLNLARAAAEMGLTVPALSRRIAMLERHLGAILFRRLPRGLALTEHGAAYAADLAPAWEAILQATASAGRRAPRRRIALTTIPTFAANWLVPRLGSFHARHPDIEVAIETVVDLVDLRARPDLDAAIRLGEGAWAGLAAEPLMPIDAVAVASPRYLAQHGPLAAPDDLRRHLLIDTSHRPEFWAEWLGAAAVDAACCRRRGYDNLQLVHEAAAAGHGIAIGLEPLLGPYLESGRLRHALPDRVRLSRGFHLVRREREGGAEGPCAAFRDWLLAEARDASPRSLAVS